MLQFKGKGAEFFQRFLVLWWKICRFMTSGLAYLRNFRFATCRFIIKISSKLFAEIVGFLFHVLTLKLSYLLCIDRFTQFLAAWFFLCQTKHSRPPRHHYCFWGPTGRCDYYVTALCCLIFTLFSYLRFFCVNRFWAKLLLTFFTHCASRSFAVNMNKILLVFCNF